MVIKKNRKTLLFGITRRIIRKRKNTPTVGWLPAAIILFANLSVPCDMAYLKKPINHKNPRKEIYWYNSAHNWIQTIPRPIQGFQLVSPVTYFKLVFWKARYLTVAIISIVLLAKCSIMENCKICKFRKISRYPWEESFICTLGYIQTCQDKSWKDHSLYFSTLS